MKTLRALVIVLFAALCEAAGAQQSKATKGKPHIIMIVADDLGWDDVSFHGSPQIPTPNLDALASTGVILNNYYVSPMDTPSRASFMTGKYALRMGVQHDTIHNRQPYGVPLSEKFLPQYLHEQGYKTHAVGKWQLGFFAKEYTPTYRGFESFFGFWSASEDYFSHVADDGGHGLDLRRNMDIVYNETGVYATEMLAREAEKVIERHPRDQPLFLYLAHQAVHVGNMDDPLQAPKRHIDKFRYITDQNRRKFAGMVSSLDESIRQLVTSLKKNGMYRNSVIIFTTDNGAAAGGLDMSAGSNYPLRGNKNTLWEGGVRGVAFVHSPLIKRPSRVYNGLMHASDWLPTLYMLSGGDPKFLGDIDGYNVWEGISKGTPSPRYEVLHGVDPMLNNRAALRVGDYKIIKNQNVHIYSDWYPRPEGAHELDYVRLPRLLNNASVDCAIKSPHPLLYAHAPTCNPDLKPCLYNIKWDPCEYHNLAGFMPNTLKVMLDRLSFYEKESKPPIYPRLDDEANPDRTGGIWTAWRDDPTIPDTENDYIYPLSYEDQATNASGFVLNQNLRKFMKDQSRHYANLTGPTSKLLFSKKIPASTFKKPQAEDKVQNAAASPPAVSVMAVPSQAPYVLPPVAATSQPSTPLTQSSAPPSTQSTVHTADHYIPSDVPVPKAATQNYTYYTQEQTTQPSQSPEPHSMPIQTTQKYYPQTPVIEPYPPTPSTTEANYPEPETTEATTSPPQTTEPYYPQENNQQYYPAKETATDALVNNSPQQTTTTTTFTPETTPPSSTSPPTPAPTAAHPSAPTQPPTQLALQQITPKENFTIKVDLGNEKNVGVVNSDYLKPVVSNPLQHLGNTYANTASSTDIQEIGTVERPLPVASSHLPSKQPLYRIPEILDIIDETTTKQHDATNGGEQASIPKIFDIIDEMHKNNSTARTEGPTATSKPLSISDVGSGMGVSLNGLPESISVFGKMGDNIISKPTERQQVVAEPKNPQLHTFFGNISIDGRTYFVVGSESDELALMKTKLEGNKIVVHMPKPTDAGDGKSSITKIKEYIDDSDDTDDEEDIDKTPVKSLAAHNITTMPSNGANGTKCEKVVQLDTSDNAVVVSSVVIVVIASAMVVGVAVVAMVAVVARHCQNARRES